MYVFIARQRLWMTPIPYKTALSHALGCFALPDEVSVRCTSLECTQLGPKNTTWSHPFWAMLRTLQFVERTENVIARIFPYSGDRALMSERYGAYLPRGSEPSTLQVR